MKTLTLLSLLFCVSCIFAQTPEQYLNAMRDSLIHVESFQYKAQMRMKSMGSDQFKDRFFEVYARWNPRYNGINYRFDWQIVERRKTGFDHIYFFTGNDFFSVVSVDKFVIHNPGVYHLKNNDYFEYMRWLVFFDELTEDPDSLYPGKPMRLTEAFTPEEFLEINIKTFETVNRILFLNKKTLFPERVIDINREPNFNIEQIIEVHLSDISLNTPLPDSVLSPQFYTEKGFDFVKPTPAAQKTEPLSEPLRDQKFETLLAKSLLVMPSGDTTTLEMLDGELFLIDFWFMACPPCLKSLPYLQSLAEKYGPGGLKLIGINCQDMESKAAVARKLDEMGIYYPNYFIEKSHSRTLDIRGFPTMILLNKHKQVIASGLGSIPNLESLIEEALK